MILNVKTDFNSFIFCMAGDEVMCCSTLRSWVRSGFNRPFAEGLSSLGLGDLDHFNSLSSGDKARLGVFTLPE